KRFFKRAIRVRECTALGLVDVRRRLRHAERTACNHAGGETGREISEQLAPVVVEAPPGADDDFVVEHFGAPRDADPWCKAPLAARERRGADALRGKQLVVAGADGSVFRRAVGIDSDPAWIGAVGQHRHVSRAKYIATRIEIE